MTSPIHNQVGSVFIPVSNVRRAAEWYSRLLGLPVREASHGGTIYDLEMQGDTGVILDASKPVDTHSPQPLLFFWCGNIGEAQAFLQQLEVEIIGTIEDIGSVSFLTFKDPDGNLLMVCQRNP